MPGKVMARSHYLVMGTLLGALFVLQWTISWLDDLLDGESEA